MSNRKKIESTRKGPFISSLQTCTKDEAQEGRYQFISDHWEGISIKLLAKDQRIIVHQEIEARFKRPEGFI